jgi:hypothetical protein
MFGKFTNLRRQLAERRTAQAESRKRVRIIVRTAGGAVVGGLLSHEAVEVLAGQSHSWWHWSTLVGAGFGAAVVAIGRDAAAVTVPLVALVATVLIGIAVFHHHDDSATADDVAFAAALDRRIGVKDGDLKVTAYLTSPAPTRDGCGSVAVEINYETELGFPVHFDPKDPPWATMTITHPARVHVMVTDASPAPRISTTRDRFGDMRTVLRWPLTDQLADLAEGFLSFQRTLELDGLALPRGVGSCYVVTPSLLGAPQRAPAGSVAVRPKAGTTDLQVSGARVLVESTEPTPDEAPTSAEVVWNCPRSRPGTSGGRPMDCAGVAAIEADWHNPFEQLALLVAGALIALVMESVVSWLRGSRG